MVIIVLIKQTLDPEEKIEISNGSIQEYGAKYIINPYDEYALEEALLIKEQNDAKVIAITVGPERASIALRTALALGVDEAILISDHDESEHSYRLASLLAKVIEPMKPDLILGGVYAIDSGNGSVALQLAQLLNLPHASAALRVQLGSAGKLGITPAPWSGTLALVERDAEGIIERVLLPLPAVITAQQGINEPRYPTLPGIMKSKKKAIIERFASELLSESILASLASSQITTEAIFPPSPRQAGQLLQGTPSQQSKELLQCLLDSNVLPKGGQ